MGPLDAGALELTQLDRDVRQADERLRQARAALQGESTDANGARSAARTQRDPLERYRHVAGQSTYRALVEKQPAAHEIDHRDALLRWIHELLQARIARDLELDDADAVHAVDDELPRGKKRTDGPAPTF